VKAKRVVAHVKTPSPAPSVLGGYSGAFGGLPATPVMRTQQSPAAVLGGGSVINPAPMDPTTVSS
jgi:hypothetical protein